MMRLLPAACCNMSHIAWLQISIFLLFIVCSLFPPLLSHPHTPPDHSVSCLLWYSQGSAIFTGINQCHTGLGRLCPVSWVMLWETSVATVAKMDMYTNSYDTSSNTIGRKTSSGFLHDYCTVKLPLTCIKLQRLHFCVQKNELLIDLDTT